MSSIAASYAVVQLWARITPTWHSSSYRIFRNAFSAAPCTSYFVLRRSRVRWIAVSIWYLSHQIHGRYFRQLAVDLLSGDSLAGISPNIIPAPTICSNVSREASARRALIWVRYARGVKRRNAPTRRYQYKSVIGQGLPTTSLTRRGGEEPTSAGPEIMRSLSNKVSAVPP